jgi:hypothetical protein
MNRIDFIKDALEINIVQATIISEMIHDIEDKDLTKFLVFRMEFIQPMKSKDLITKEALFAYNRKKIELGIKDGVNPFNDTKGVYNYLQSFYKGKEIANGAGCYKDFVIIGLDRDGEFINKYVINEYGNYKKLNSEDVESVLSWLLENPKRIGNIQRVQETNEIQIEYKQECFSDDISPKISQMIKGITNE